MSTHFSGEEGLGLTDTQAVSEVLTAAKIGADRLAGLRPDRSLSVREMLRKYGITAALEQDVTEVAVNRPGELWLESSKGWRCEPAPILTLANLQSLATTIAVFNQKRFDRDTAIGSFTLPMGERCQVMQAPVCENGVIALSIRKPSPDRFTLADYAKTGRLNPKVAGISDTILPWEVQLLALMKERNFERFFELAVEHRLNIVTVGGTGSGKTTFSKALIDLYPRHRRLFTVEDAHELTTPYHPNSVHLFFSPVYPAKVILASLMRMKPDHVFITELRGDEAWDYLMALKSGHAGSVTSTHANDCLGALYKIGSYVKQSDVGRTLDFSYIMREVMTTIDVVVSFDHTYLSEIYYDPTKKLQLLKGEA